MNKLSFDGESFLNISLEECLSYDVYQKLELIVKNAVDLTIKKIEHYDSISKEQKPEYFLQHILLRLSTNDIWLKLSKENNLNQLYLYKVIRKHLYLRDPEFFN